jgi:protein-tyrosine phosphatase
MIKVLFVCMGNICRSPAAEEIFRAKVKKANLEEEIQCDSAGTHGYHSGAPSDARMSEHARRRGYALTHRARKFEPELDFEDFDYILYMDDQNESALKEHTHRREFFPRLKRLSDYCSRGNVLEVPDPYYGGDEGFEHVLEIVEDATSALLAEIVETHKLRIS